MPKIDIGLTITGVNNATSSIRGASDEVKKLGENAQATANRLKAIQVVIAGILIEKTQEWAKALVTAAAASQGAELRMAAFAGGATNAQKVMTDLADSFKSVPLDLENIGDAWTHMQAAVANNGKTTSIIKAIVNDVTAMGGKDENVNNLASSFQRLYARGYASSREFMSIVQQTGLTIGDLAKGAGQSAAQFSRNLQGGFVSAQQFTDAFIAASKQRFGDYAEMMKNTVGGALANVQNSFKEGFNKIGDNTNLNANLAHILNIIADAITKLMGSIDQKTIDMFLNWIVQIAPLAINAARALGDIAVMALNVGAALASILSIIPPDALELGIIGYALWGRKGAIALTLLGTAELGVRKLGQTIDQFAVDHNFFASYFAADKAKLNNSTLQVLTGQINKLSNTNSKAFADSWNAAIAKIQANLKKMGSTKLGGGAPGTGISPQAQAAIEAAQAMTQKLRDSLAQGVNSIDQMNYATSGDKLGANINELWKKQLDFNKGVDAAAAAEAKLKVHLPENVALIAQMVAQKSQFTLATEAAVEKLKDEYHAESLIYGLQQKSTQLQQTYSAMQLKIANDASAIGQAFQGTQAGQSALATLGKQNQLTQQLNSLSQQRVQIAQQLADFDRNPNLSAADLQRKTALEGTLATTQQLTAATQDALSTMTTQGELAKQMWQGIGNAIENDVSNGLTGFIEGTESLGDVMRSVFNDMISLSIKYLIQLGEQQLFAEAANTAALAMAGPTALAMAALWGPAATAASIATLGAADITGVAAYQAAMATSAIPFANGGVPTLNSMSSSLLTGPTLFGIGGEAGTEAVMPLTRIGGKLGVRSAGGGGDVHLHLNAIDAQSGVDFLAQNAQVIQALLGRQRMLNQGEH